MNPMDELRAARPAYYDAQVDETTRAGELAHAMAQPRRTQSRKAWRPVWGLGLAGAAAATAVAVTVSVAGGGGVGVGAGGGSTGVTALGSPGAAATPEVARLSAKQLLLVAAESSRKTPVAEGAYWHRESTSGVAQQVGTKVKYVVNTLGRAQFWIASTPDRPSYWVSQNLGTKPAKGQEDAWRQDGSPTNWKIQVGTKRMSVTVDAGSGKPSRDRIDVNGKVFDLAGHNASMAELRALPTTAEGLKRYLLKGYQGHGTEANTPMDADAWLFQVTAGLLEDMPVKPATRAAAYKVLAGIDGVRNLGQVTDALGRTATGVGRTETWPTGRFERQLLIDPDTGALLTDQYVAVEPRGEYSWAKPGTPINWTATIKASWTDETPDS
ncbi:CU044_5270 family protein [Microbispora sp. RL4-1S]|uniref:CU044_5270 family protein n=1 Tax=Microbispora oryzae TaxID=2806554 RepID=A0A940WIH3_9ACTN|nr:CU044_5270 family protein [Microbispora oryzae]MBP2705533.1 CU044_5270 family protein [Microbispora oryzae]